MPSLRITPAYFERPIDRRSGDSVKWNKYDGQDVIPLWVADMDFVSAPEIVTALHARAAHGVFGYTVPYEEVIAEVIAPLQTPLQPQISASSGKAATAAIGSSGDPPW